GELTITRSRPRSAAEPAALPTGGAGAGACDGDQSASRSTLVGECAPPSTNSTPPIVTGSKKLGIAHDAATASATGAGGAPGRPNTTRLPSRRRTAVSHKFRSGQSDPNNGRNAAATRSVGIAPAGSAPASITPGRFIQNGRSAARMSSDGDAMRGRPRRRVGPVGKRAGPSPIPARAASSAPSGDTGSPVERAARSRGENPARSSAPTTEPADVPTITSASRGSQPVAVHRPSSTPAWKA